MYINNTSSILISISISISIIFSIRISISSISINTISITIIIAGGLLVQRAAGRGGVRPNQHETDQGSAEEHAGRGFISYHVTHNDIYYDTML